jgi:hypothetical protein
MMKDLVRVEYSQHAKERLIFRSVTKRQVIATIDTPNNVDEDDVRGGASGRPRPAPTPAFRSGVVTGNIFGAIPDLLSDSFLPILTLVILTLSVYAMTMRNSMVSVLKEDFMLAAPRVPSRSRPGGGVRGGRR